MQLIGTHTWIKDFYVWMQGHFDNLSDSVAFSLGQEWFLPWNSSLPCLYFQDFMASCRHSAPRIILIPKELCHPAAPAVWYLPLRTVWFPPPWVKPVLMFSTEPSPHTQASQCTICLQLPQASLGNLFEVAQKIPRSCSLALWTAVLASSPLCIPKAESSCTFGTFE